MTTRFVFMVFFVYDQHWRSHGGARGLPTPYSDVVGCAQSRLEILRSGGRGRHAKRILPFLLVRDFLLKNIDAVPLFRIPGNAAVDPNSFSTLLILFIVGEIDLSASGSVPPFHAANVCHWSRFFLRSGQFLTIIHVWKC